MWDHTDEYFVIKKGIHFSLAAMVTGLCIAMLTLSFQALAEGDELVVCSNDQILPFSQDTAGTVFFVGTEAAVKDLQTALDALGIEATIHLNPTGEDGLADGLRVLSKPVAFHDRNVSVHSDQMEYGERAVALNMPDVASYCGLVR